MSLPMEYSFMKHHIPRTKNRFRCKIKQFVSFESKLKTKKEASRCTWCKFIFMRMNISGKAKTSKALEIGTVGRGAIKSFIRCF